MGSTVGWSTYVKQKSWRQPGQAAAMEHAWRLEEAIARRSFASCGLTATVSRFATTFAPLSLFTLSQSIESASFTSSPSRTTQSLESLPIACRPRVLQYPRQTSFVQIWGVPETFKSYQSHRKKAYSPSQQTQIKS